MVGAENFRQNFCSFYFFCNFFRNENVINPPADVSRSGIGEMAPPGIVAIPFSENSKSIYEACFNYFIYAFALFLGESFLAFIFFWSCQIVGSMGYVQVPAEYHRLLFSKRLH